MQNIYNYWTIIARLIIVDFKTFKREYVGKLIDSLIWVGISMLVTKYILPALDIPATYTIITFSGLLATAPLMEIYPNSMGIAADLTGPRTIFYDLILPLPSWLIPLQRALSFSLRSATIACWMLPLGKLFLWDELSLATIAWSKFALIFVLSNMFSAVFALLLGSMIKDLTADHTWMRVVFPLWFLGGFQFSWYALYSVWPAVAYINLLNPFIYITEGVRATLLGQQAYLPFWFCIGAIILFTTLFGWLAIMRMKKQLDFV